MRAVPLILLAASVIGGCATRLPVEHRTPPAASLTRTQPTIVRATGQEFDETLGSVRPTDGSFLRCSLEHDPERREAEEERKRHELGLSLGYTFERGDGGFTVGVDYAYWITERFGVGPFFDFVTGDIDAFATGAGIWFRPFRCLEDLTFQVALGVDISPEEEEGEHGEEGERSYEVAALLRLGVTYAWDLGRGWRLGPTFVWDGIYPDKQAYSFVLTLAKEF